MKNLSNTLISLLKESEELYSHSEEVSQLAYQFGIYLGLGFRDVQTLKFGGFLHDIGKVRIPKETLFKTTRLTDEEFLIIKDHPNKGYQLLLETKQTFSKEIYSIVLEHHERIDGKGYPNRLADKEIHPLAKIISLCDVYSAITMKRSYKDSFDSDFAVLEIKKGLGTQFDKDLGEHFIQFLSERESYEISSHTNYTETV